MSPLQLKVLGLAFKLRLERLERAFSAASQPFRSEIARIDQEAEDLAEAGSAVLVDPDTGERFDQLDDLSDRRESELDSLDTIRRAFALLAYHAWERMAQRWSSASSSDHDKLVRAGKAAGVPLDEQGLEVLRHLANTLKHNSKKSAPKLHSLRPGLFEAGFDPTVPHPVTGKARAFIHWESRLEITDDHIKEFFAILRRSAPR